MAPIILALLLGAPVRVHGAETLLSLATKAAQARDAQLGAGAVRYLHLAGVSLKVLPEIAAARATDGLSHDFYAGFQDGAAVCVVFGAQKRAKGTVKERYYKADMTGKLEHAAAISGALDDDGNPVAGSGRLSELDPEDADVAREFRHETDFWLKGKYRKTPAAPAPKS